MAYKPLTFQLLSPSHKWLTFLHVSPIARKIGLPFSICFTSIPESCRATHLCPLGNSDHAVVSVNIFSYSITSKEPPTNRTSFCYQRADWDSFRDFLRYVPWNVVFNLPVQKCASEVSSWVKAGIEAFIPARKYKVKSRLLTWFSAACSASVAHRNHFFRLYHSDISDCNRCLFVSACNECNRVFSEAKTLFAEWMKQRIVSCKFGPKDWRTKQQQTYNTSFIQTIWGPDFLSW